MESFWKIQHKGQHGVVPNPIIILIQPQLPENLGAVARAMANFALTDLRLVDPLCSPDDQKAIATAAGADDILINCQVFPNFNSAIEDVHVILGTCAQFRHMIKPSWPLSYGAQQIIKTNDKTGVIFGPERTGLTNDQLSRCHAIIQIPTNPHFSSLNLAQAVLLLAYELYGQSVEVKPRLQMGETQLATQQQISQWLDFLETTLDETNFWRVQSKKPIMWRNLTNIFTRIHLTEQEVRTLYGLIDNLRYPRRP
jgi:tRNA/rRNA methyltransferase